MELTEAELRIHRYKGRCKMLEEIIWEQNEKRSKNWNEGSRNREKRRLQKKMHRAWPVLPGPKIPEKFGSA